MCYISIIIYLGRAITDIPAFVPKKVKLKITK